MAKTVLTQAEKDMVDSMFNINSLTGIGQDEAELMLRLVVRVADQLNDLPLAPANNKTLYNKTAKVLRWVANYFDEKAAAIP